ncbi:MAG: sensor domain-containing diguanylate cyclase [Pseudomonadota bacterium]|nr:sensor domain-containing diguanylate cyclase [Pseudomonadota bacterium]
MRRLLCLLLAMLPLLFAASAVPSSNSVREVALQGAESALQLSPHVTFLHDPSGRMDLAAVQASGATSGFRPLPEGNATFGFQDGAYWFHARIRNQQHRETRWLLVQQYALSDHIDVYSRYRDGRVVHDVGGDMQPFDRRAIGYRHPNFWIDLPRGEPVDLFVRIESQSSMQVPLALYTPKAFAELARDSQLGIGLYYGILLALFFSNLVLWLWLRDHSHAWYLFHISAFGMVLFCLNGLAFEYFWPNWVWAADKSVPVMICLAQIGMQQFARNFLELDRRWLLGDRIGRAMIVFFGLLIVAALLLPYRIVTPIASQAVFLSVLWIIVETVVVLRRGYAPAKLFLLAWAVFLVATAMFTAVAFNIMPKNFLTEYGVQIGSALEMLLLSIALAYRYASLRNRNEQLVREANEQLEHNVSLRTAELSHALEQLGEANGRLRESSRRDALTGVYNRRHFRESFERILHDARHDARPVSLLMADLDHFKHVNDTHGHLVGDDCLRWVARCLDETLADYNAVVARFGGEEFIAVLPGSDMSAAMRAGESLRQRISARPLRVGDRDIRLTISIGVHAIDTSQDSRADDAIRAADEALYAAKGQGRDCVRPALATGLA